MPSSKPKQGENDLATKRPDIAAEWHPLKNHPLTPSDVTHASQKKVWWKCQNSHEWQKSIQGRTKWKNVCPTCNSLGFKFPELGKEANGWDPFSFSYGYPKDLSWKCARGHTWDASPNSRTNRGSGCPYCSNKKVLIGFNDLETVNPELAKEWHFLKNKDLKPSHVVSGSKKVVWWQCSINSDHQWEIGIGNRQRGSGCPYCSGNRFTSERSLKNVYPKVAEEWHPLKNHSLTPADVTYGSTQKVWWQCQNAHEWQQRITERTSKKTSCPICNSLEYKYPDIAEEWHPLKNQPLTPSDVSYGSNQEIWWQCPIDQTHFYKRTVKERTQSGASVNSCPICNSLEYKFPDIAEEWHEELNKPLKPIDVSWASSTQKVWWQCSKIETHIWDAYVAARTSAAEGCPFCAGVRLSPERSLAVLSPDIAKEWHESKNGELSPQNVFNGSALKVWWRCKRFPHHEWKVSISSRTNPNRSNGCPFCSNQSSAPEIRILSELEYLFDNVVSRKKIDGIEIDIFLEDFCIGIEFDGYYYHKDKEVKDKHKNTLLKKKNIELIRVREKPLEKLFQQDLIINDYRLKKIDVNNLCLKIDQLIQKKYNSSIKKFEDYLLNKSFLNEARFNFYLSCFPNPLPENSLKNTHKELCKEWDVKKNFPLLPHNFTYGSSQNIWWRCLKNNHHSWQATIGSRTRGTGCPFCARKKLTADSEKSLLKKFPNISRQWNYKKNGDITPDQVFSKSERIVWWQCEKFEDHEWQQQVCLRVKSPKIKCPICASIQFVYPEIAKLIHPSKNENIDLKYATPQSNKTIWWQCSKYKNHEWDEKIRNRVNRKDSTDCPVCKSIVHLYPETAKQWSFKRNIALKPFEITPGSEKEVWWQCEKFEDHEWQQQVCLRVKSPKIKCPICQSLLFLYPQIAKQWHPTKNEPLQLKQIAAQSHKEVWWQCLRNERHIWKEGVRKRTKRKVDRGCPFCKKD